MPWQSLPPLIIICGAFTITGLGLRGLDNLFLGRNRRIRVNEFEYQLDQRTLKVKAAKEKTAKEAKETQMKEDLQKKLAVSSS